LHCGDVRAVQAGPAGRSFAWEGNEMEERRDQSNDPIRRDERLTAEVGGEGGSYAEGLRSAPEIARLVPAPTDAPAYGVRGSDVAAAVGTATPDPDVVRYPSDPPVETASAEATMTARTLGIALGFSLGLAVASMFCLLWMWRKESDSDPLSAPLPD
jgi:hypothetical protein